MGSKDSWSFHGSLNNVIIMIDIVLNIQSTCINMKESTKSFKLSFANLMDIGIYGKEMEGLGYSNQA